MRYILAAILLLFFYDSYSQSGYTQINNRYNWLAGQFSALNLPGRGTGDTTLASGQSTMSGAILADTVNNVIYWRSSGRWWAVGGVIDTASMLLPYLRKVDTSAMLAPYAKLSALDSLNLVVARAGDGEKSFFAQNDTLLLKDVSGETFIVVDTKNDSTLRWRIDTASAGLKAYIAANSGVTPAWLLTGNGGLSSSTNYIGTTDAVRMNFRTYDTTRLILTDKGKFMYDSSYIADPSFSVIFHPKIDASTGGFLIKPKTASSSVSTFEVQTSSSQSLFYIRGGSVTITSSASNLSLVAPLFNTNAGRGQLIVNNGTSTNANGLFYFSGNVGTSSIINARQNGAATSYAITAQNSSGTTTGGILGNGTGIFSALNLPTGAAGTTGTATLVAGTVTVNTTAVTASSKIFVSVDTPGGTQGFLSAPTASITAATSFVINSSSNTETSTVYWCIIN